MLLSFVCLHLQLLELAPKLAKGHGRAGEASWQRLRSGCLELLLQVLNPATGTGPAAALSPWEGPGPVFVGAGQGAACPPCTHLQQLAGSAGPSVTTDARTALKVGERNQLQKTSPVFPPGSSKSGWQTKANVVTSKSCWFQQSGSKFTKAFVEEHYRLHKGSRNWSLVLGFCCCRRMETRISLAPDQFILVSWQLKLLLINMPEWVRWFSLLWFYVLKCWSLATTPAFESLKLLVLLSQLFFKLFIWAVWEKQWEWLHFRWELCLDEFLNHVTLCLNYTVRQMEGNSQSAFIPRMCFCKSDILNTFRAQQVLYQPSPAFQKYFPFFPANITLALTSMSLMQEIKNYFPDHNWIVKLWKEKQVH